jgi:hypothetical protein
MASGVNFVPPGGFAGFSQMTPASRAALVGTRRAPASRKRRKKASGSRSKVARNGRSKGGRKLKFGSPAWRKKYMKKKKRK